MAGGVLGWIAPRSAAMATAIRWTRALRISRERASFPADWALLRFGLGASEARRGLLFPLQAGGAERRFLPFSMTARLRCLPLSLEQREGLCGLPCATTWPLARLIRLSRWRRWRDGRRRWGDPPGDRTEAAFGRAISRVARKPTMRLRRCTSKPESDGAVGAQARRQCHPRRRPGALLRYHIVADGTDFPLPLVCVVCYRVFVMLLYWPICVFRVPESCPLRREHIRGHLLAEFIRRVAPQVFGVVLMRCIFANSLMSHLRALVSCERDVLS